MKLITDWKRKFPKLWSVRLSLLAALCSAAEVSFNVALTGKAPVIVVVAGLVSLAAAIARVVAQAGFGDDE